MIRYETRATIRRPPRVVYDAMLDPNRYSEWTDMTDMRWQGDGPPVIGTRGRFRLPKSPFKGDLDVEIVELEPDRRVVFRVTHPALTWISWADIAPDGEDSHFVYGGEMTLRGWRRLLEPMLRSELAAGEAKEVERLKSLLEAEAPVGAPA